MKEWLGHKRIRIAMAALAAGIVLAGGLLWHYQAKPYHFSVVKPGALYRSGTLTPAHLEAVLKQHGIRTVVNLRAPDGEGPPDWYRREAEVCEKLSVQLVNIPMRADQPPTPDKIAKWLDLFNSKSGLPLLVHCKNGVVRTGMMVGLYQIEVLGQDPQRTLAELPAFGHDLQAAEYKFFRDLILNYTPHRTTPAPTAK